MAAMLVEHPHVFWLTLGGLLLAAEMLGTGGYLLWSGIAAVIVGILSWLVPLNWEWQGFSFALLTVLSAFGWWRWMATRSRERPANGINQRGQSMIGQVLVLDEALSNGRGQVRIGDGHWPVIADCDLPAGTRVKVVAIEGITLRIESCPSGL
ncbi:NfeD family protein [Erwinia sp. CPCC 100877]|nr:NfeD family protein [Erwinia sp. CPCC 100877]